MPRTILMSSIIYHLAMAKLYRLQRNDYRRDTKTWWHYTNSMVNHNMLGLKAIRAIQEGEQQ